PLARRARGALDRALAPGALGRGSGTMKHRVAAAGVIVILACTGLEPAAQPSSPREAVERMLARLLRAPEFASRVFLTRSDPFGGPDEVTEGRVWFLPGRGLRFRSVERGGEDIVADKEKGTFLVYRPAERTVYRADWERAPARMRQLVTEPERLLDADYRAVRERRRVAGAWREGYR